MAFFIFLVVARDYINIESLIFGEKKIRPFTQKVRDHGFIVLASQLLTDLRDAILCPNDYMWTEEMSESPEVFQEAGNKSQKINTPESVFFFINNTFYNDRRIPCHEDTSRYGVFYSISLSLVSPMLSRVYRQDFSEGSLDPVIFRFKICQFHFTIEQILSDIQKWSIFTVF